MDQATMLACARCGHALAPEALVCPNCGVLVYKTRLEQLATEATQYEQTDPATAIRIWQQALELLPVESPQFHMIQDRIRLLSGAAQAVYPGQAYAPNTLPYQSAFPPAPRQETFASAVFKTGGSMLISIIVYALFMQNLLFAAGFVVLILVPAGDR